MKEKLIALVALLFSTSFVFGQGEPSITITTTRAVGTNISISINADVTDRSGVWIDLNNNGVRDSGEGVSTWNSGVNYGLQSQTFTIYGNVTSLNCQNQGLTHLDLSNASHLTFLRVDNNSIGELDLSALPREFYNLHISRNNLTGVLDVSHLEELQTMNIDRNYLTSVNMGNHPSLGRNINISKNLFSETAIDAILAAVPDRSSTQDGSFYLIDTRTSNDRWAEEENELKQHHLDHQVFTGYNWRPLDVPGATVMSDITRLTNRYSTSFTTARSSGEITLNIDAEESDYPSVWVDLNGNGQRDGNETVTSFGTDVSYPVSSANIAVYGLASRVSAVNNELTKVNATNNPYLEELNIALNSLTIAEITQFIETLTDRTSTTAGSLTLIDFDGGDANQAISDHVTLANAKNWDVKDATGRILSPSDIVSLQQTIRDLVDIAAYPGQEITLPETTDQGLVVTYTVEPGNEDVATLDGNILTALAYGELVVTATQEGNELYEEFSTTVTVTVTTVGETYNWLEIPTLGVMGNNVFVAGDQEAASQFIVFYVNNTLVEAVDGNVDISDYEGTIELKATNEDGTQVIRLVIEK